MLYAVSGTSGIRKAFEIKKNYRISSPSCRLYEISRTFHTLFVWVNKIFRRIKS